MASPQPIPIPRICHFPLRSAKDRSTSYVLSHIWIHYGYWHLYQVLGWMAYLGFYSWNECGLIVYAVTSVASNSVIPWTVTNQAPLSIDLPVKNTGVDWDALFFRELPYTGIEPPSLMSHELTVGSLRAFKHRT